jgi:triacylglycerol lipase
MGGLDARYAISNRPDLVDRVATLVTIGAPHRGALAADAVVKKTGPLFDNIPDFLKRKLEYNAGALHDLSTEACIPFDEQTTDVPSVRYINIAGNASKGGNELLLRSFATQIINVTGEINDGIVTKSSALRAGNEHMPDWPVDHAGEIGLTKALLNPVQHEAAMAAHLARYDSIVAVL